MCSLIRRVLELRRVVLLSPSYFHQDECSVCTQLNANEEPLVLQSPSYFHQDECNVCTQLNANEEPLVFLISRRLPILRENIELLRELEKQKICNFKPL